MINSMSNIENTDLLALHSAYNILLSVYKRSIPFFVDDVFRESTHFFF